VLLAEVEEWSPPVPMSAVLAEPLKVAGRLTD
jgi:hypothetical protein